MMVEGRDVVVTGGTGYIGRALVAALIARGHRVRVLVRGSSAGRVPVEAVAVVGDVLDAKSVKSCLRAGDVVVHLVGTPHPSPSKAEEFIRVDLGSIRSVAKACAEVGVRHLAYVSVAHPTPVMKAYVSARLNGEEEVQKAKLKSTILRPWYVLGPGHRWPIVLLPFYWIASLVPAWRDGARRLGLVTLAQMVAKLVEVVEDGSEERRVRIVDVPEIRTVCAS